MSRLIITAALTTLASAALASAATFAGNGGTGFGGPIGGSSITVTESTPGTISFSLTTGAAFTGNALVLYVDSVAGGVNSNSTLTDTADGGRTAISGLSSVGRALVTFPVGFGADYGIAVEPGSFAGAFDINNTPSNFGFVAGGGLAGSGTGPFTFSFTRAQLGLPVSGGSFSFVGSLISTSAYRANETIGTSVTLPDPTNLGTAPNAGFTGTQTFALANTVVLPEPTTLAALGGIAIAAVRRRK